MKGIVRWLWYVPAICVAAAIYAASSLPEVPEAVSEAVWDKALHTFAFALLGACLWVALRMANGLSMVRSALWAFAMAACYGIVDEMHQGHVPGRHREAADLVADWIGSWAGSTAGAVAGVAVGLRKRVEGK